MPEAKQTDDKNTAQKLQEHLGVTQEIILKKPTTLGGGEYIEKLTVRAVTIGDIRAVANIPNEIERELGIFARITSLVPEDLDLLHYDDYRQLQATFR